VLAYLKVEVSFLEIYCGKIRDLGRAYRDRMAAATGAAGAAGGDPTDKPGNNNGGSEGSAAAAFKSHAAKLKRGSSLAQPPSPGGGKLTAEAMTSDVYLRQAARRAETFQRGGAHGGEKYDQRRPSLGGSAVDSGG
jgi:hypothetical protein